MFRQALVEPIVACRLGYLYNKENVLSKLLEKSLPKKFSHIRSMKRDLVEVHFTPNPAAGSDSNASPWICPITSKPLSSKYKYVLAIVRLIETIKSNVCLW